MLRNLFERWLFDPRPMNAINRHLEEHGWVLTLSSAAPGELGVVWWFPILLILQSRNWIDQSEVLFGCAVISIHKMTEPQSLCGISLTIKRYGLQWQNTWPLQNARQLQSDVIPSGLSRSTLAGDKRYLTYCRYRSTCLVSSLAIIRPSQIRLLLLESFICSLSKILSFINYLAVDRRGKLILNELVTQY